MPYAIVDKVQARLYVFDAGHRFQGASAVLLGAAPGDTSAPDIGARGPGQIRAHEKTTPAGRYVSEPGTNLRGERVVWIDYDGALSMHPVLTTNRSERRLQRLATPTARDNRISSGCVNVPTRFHREVVLPTLGRGPAVIYVMPEQSPVSQRFSRLGSLRAP